MLSFPESHSLRQALSSILPTDQSFLRLEDWMCCLRHKAAVFKPSVPRASSRELCDYVMSPVRSALSYRDGVSIAQPCRMWPSHHQEGAMGLFLSSPFFRDWLLPIRLCQSRGGKKGALIPCLPLIKRAGSVTRNDNLSEMRCLQRGPKGSKAVPSSHARDPFLPLAKAAVSLGNRVFTNVYFPL